MKKLLLTFLLLSSSSFAQVQTLFEHFNQSPYPAGWVPVLVQNPTYLSFEDFGAYGDGVHDDTSAIQRAINAAAGSNAIVETGGHIWNISQTIVVGNGSTNSPSMTNDIQIIGLGPGATSAEIAPAYTTNKFQWVGATNGTMFFFAGPMHGVRLQGLMFDCNSIAGTAIALQHVLKSHFEELTLAHYLGTALTLTAYGAPMNTAVGASDDVFINVHCEAPGSGGNGMSVGSSTNGGVLDVARDSWIGCEFWRDGTSNTTFSVQLRYVDACQFFGGQTYAQGGTNGVGLYINAPAGNTNFPSAIVFYNTPIQGGVSIATNTGIWGAVQGFGFFPYPLGDGEPLPHGNFSNQFYGFDSTGNMIH